MNRLLSAFGVDPAQWKALTIAGLKHDLRSATFGGVRSTRSRPVHPFAFQLGFYVIFGAFMALAVYWISDVFAAALLVITYVMVMIGTAMLADHNATLASPMHYAVLAFQPISSRTWFASRLANILAYTLAMTAALGTLPVVAFFVKDGLVVGAAAAVALVAACTTTSVVLVVGFAAIIQRVGAQRLRSVLSYVQLATGLVIYGGFFFFMEEASKEVFASLSIPKSGWVLAFPGTWFASYVEIAAGRIGATEVIPALASVVLLVSTVYALRGRLSLDYARRLGELASSSSAVRRAADPIVSSKRRLWFRTGEARAIAVLIRAQFRDDIKFRMSVLGIVPLTILYLFMGLRDAAGESATAANLTPVTLAVLLFPAMLKMNLGRSDSFRASWIFFATPADRTGIIRSATNVLVVFFLLPYLAFVGATLGWFTHDASYVALYVVIAGLLGRLALLFITLLDPELPFSKPMAKGQSTAATFAMIIGFSIVGGLLPILLRVIRGSIGAIVITVIVIVLTSLIVDRMTRARIERLAARLDFQG